MREGVRDRSKAIVVLLLKLNNTAEVTEAAAASAKDEVAREQRDSAEDIERASSWIAEHPDIRAAIDEQLERDFPANGDEFVQLGMRLARSSLTVTAWRNAGSPESVHAA